MTIRGAGTPRAAGAGAVDSTRRIMVAGRQALELTIEQFTVVVEQGPDRGASVVLTGPSIRIGKGTDCDLVLSDGTVSQRHAVLTLTPQGVMVEDLSSTNGTWVGGVRVKSAYVPTGGQLRLGASVLAVRQGPGPWILYPDDSHGLGGLLGKSQAMREVFAVVRQLARTDLPVLVTGETGSGKELVARAIHGSGPRRDKPFQVVDCGAIVPGLLASELFGHERGAFTGADRAAKGVLEEASGGTVVLDEVGEIDLAVQPQLLRAIEVREVTRLGSRRAVPVDFRVVAATNRDLRAEAAAGRFRADLYYRLACVTIRLPPLRERIEDIALLADHFVSECARRHGIPAARMSPEAREVLETHPWPGNVRELRNVCEAACVMAGSGTIESTAIARLVAASAPLPRRAAPTGPIGIVGHAPGMRASAAAGPSPGASSAESHAARKAGASGSLTLEDAERAAIEAALAATGGNKKAAARRLQISPTTLLAKIRKYGIAGGSDNEA